MEVNIPNIIITHKCIGNKILQSFCMDSKCLNQNNFLCFDNKCQCKLEHKSCLKGGINFVLKAINKKLYVYANFIKSKITDYFESII